MTETVYEKVEVPEELLRKCPQPDLSRLDSNGGMEQALGEAIISIDLCNDDKTKIKEWSESP